MAPYVPCYPTISGESLTRAVVTMEQTFTPHALAAALAGRRMAALDLETTGLDISSRWPGAAGGADRPTQVAVLPFTDGVLTGPALVELVDPCRPIGPVAQSLTGIGDADVAGAATWAAVLPRIVEAVGDRTVVVHNAVFDIEALRDMIDTVQDPARARELPAGTDAAGMWRGTVIDHHREQATYDRLAAADRPGDDPLAGGPPAEAAPAPGPAR